MASAERKRQREREGTCAGDYANLDKAGAQCSADRKNGGAQTEAKREVTIARCWDGRENRFYAWVQLLERERKRESGNTKWPSTNESACSAVN